VGRVGCISQGGGVGVAWVEGTGGGSIVPPAPPGMCTEGEGVHAGQGWVCKLGDGVGVAWAEGTGGGCAIPPMPPSMCAEGEGVQAAQGRACKLGAGVV